MAPRLMAVQVDDAGGAHARPPHRGARADRAHRRDDRARSLGERPGRRAGAAGRATPIDADVVVFSAGIRPRDALARAAGLDLAERGGVLVDEQCRTSDPHVWAIGECAAPGGRMYGLVAPGYAMAEVVVDALLGGAGRLHRRRHVHQAQAARRRRGVLRRRVRHHRGRPRAGLRRRGRRASTRSWSSPRTARRLLGGILVGDASAYGVLRPMVASRHRAARQPRGADPAGRPRRRRAAACPTRRRSARATTSPRQIDDRRRGRRCDGRVRHRLHPGRHHLRLLQAGGEEDRRGVLRSQSAGSSTAACASTSR